MKETKKYYWLKLKKDFFAQKYIRALRKMQDGDSMVIICMKMLLASLDSEGRLLFENIADDPASEIALFIDEDETIVAKTLGLLVKMGVCELCDNGDVIMLEHEDLVGSESESAQRVRNHRKRRALQCNKNVTTEIEKDKEIEKEIEKETDTYKDAQKETKEISSGCADGETGLTSSSACADTRISYEPDYVVDLFNSICKSLPKVTKMTDSRKRLIRNSTRLLDCELSEFFERVENSDFLTGREGDWNGCSFDWIFKPANMVKILEGNYDNREKAPQTQKAYGAAYDISEYESYSAYDDMPDYEPERSSGSRQKDMEDIFAEFESRSVYDDMPDYEPEYIPSERDWDID